MSVQRMQTECGAPADIIAKKRRFVLKADAVSASPDIKKRKTTAFADLPVEVLGDIVGNLDVKCVISLLSSCKFMKSLMHPEGFIGRCIWHKVRKREGWPDPIVIGLTDFQFLKCKHGRGCNFCTDAPRVRTPKWEFKGVRMCERCVHEHTTRDYTLDVVEESRCRYLPSIEVSGWTRSHSRYGSAWTYRMYLTKSIPCHNLTETEEDEMRIKLDVLSTFIREVNANDVRMETTRRKKLDELVAKRTVDVDECMKSNFPVVHPKLYNSLKSYQNATSKSTPFNRRSRAMFLRYVTKEFEENRLRFYKIQSDLHLHDLCQAKGLSCNFTEEETESIHKDMKFLTYTDVESRMDLAIQDKLRIRRQKDWSVRYIQGRVFEDYDVKELRGSISYVLGRPEDERGFAELAQTICLRIARRFEWIQKYLGAVYLSTWTGQDVKALFDTDEFKTALPENENVFATLAHPVCERAARRNDWWKKYVENTPIAFMQTELYEIDAFRTADKDQESEFSEQVKNRIMLENWGAEVPEEIIERSKTERVLWCRKCRFCASKGATFDKITQHRSECKGLVGVLQKYAILSV